MGWFYDKPDLPACYDHEGFVVALTKDRTSGQFEELRFPNKATYEGEAIARIQAGCECGWRSSYLVPSWGVYRGENHVFHLPRYSPSHAWVTEADEERCSALWYEHMLQMVPELALVRTAEG